MTTADHKAMHARQADTLRKLIAAGTVKATDTDNMGNSIELLLAHLDKSVGK